MAEASDFTSSKQQPLSSAAILQLKTTFAKHVWNVQKPGLATNSFQDGVEGLAATHHPSNLANCLGTFEPSKHLRLVERVNFG